MKKNLLLYILLIFLILVNGFFLFNHLGKPHLKGPQEPKEPFDFIVKELNFNNDQIKNFEALNTTHRKKMKAIFDGIKELKDELFVDISNPEMNENKLDSITTLIGNYEKEKETELFNHFRSIRIICNEKQKKKLNRIMRDALHHNNRKGQRPPRR